MRRRPSQPATGSVPIAGAPGGARIPEYVAQSLVAMPAFGAAPAAAADVAFKRDRFGIVKEPVDDEGRYLSKVATCQR